MWFFSVCIYCSCFMLNSVPVTELQLIIFMVTIVLFGGLILCGMYEIFKCFVGKFNELRKRL